MKDCDIIQPELSAYIDGELTPAQQQRVDAHLAACSSCQQALAELKTLAAGVAALPKLEPTPQLLAQVRRKISRGYDPEAPTWFDYLFRPFWVKVPMEAAALIAVALMVTQFRQPLREEAAPGNQFAQAENRVAQQPSSMEERRSSDKIAPNEPTPETAAPVPQVTLADNAAPAAPAAGPAAAPETSTASSGAGVSTDGIESESTATPRHEYSSITQPAAAPIGQGIKARLEAQRRVASVSHPLASLGPAPMPSAAAVSTLARTAGVEPSRLGDVVVVRSRDLRAVQGRAEELAARCNGKVISVPPSMDSTEQLFFVEVPREYVASFKLDMQQLAGASGPSTSGTVARVAAFTTNAPALSATSTARVVGVLTGGMETNVGFDARAYLALANNPQAEAAATMVLQIFVVPPPGVALTNTALSAPAH
ncbi:MAG TPA: anti-sigma factor [Verrucomicrobiae bacterium]|nr:anti-sigma factor [Verrucomicrobiae bacterium]